MYVLDEPQQIYGLPPDPELPAAATVRDVLKWVGAGAAATAVLGFVLNYVIAREAIITGKLPGKEQMSKRKKEEE